MDFNAALQSFAHINNQFGGVLDTALLIFARMVGFTLFGPIFNRKNIPVIFKVVMAIFLTSALLWVIPVGAHGSFSKGEAFYFVVQMIINLTIGTFIGFIASMILETVFAAGNLLTNQIGLSQAMFQDPATNQQTMILEALFSMLTIVVFLNMGGMYWMILALKRSFTLFPLYQIQQPLFTVVDLDYVVQLSGNIFTVGVLLIAPVIVVTMAVDIILGIVNRAAQNMPVFQLSFALKPSIGIAVMLVTLPIFLEALVNYLNKYANIF